MLQAGLEAWNAESAGYIRCGVHEFRAFRDHADRCQIAQDSDYSEDVS